MTDTLSRRCARCGNVKLVRNGMMARAHGRGSIAGATFICLDCIRTHADRHPRPTTPTTGGTDVSLSLHR